MKQECGKLIQRIEEKVNASEDTSSDPKHAMLVSTKLMMATCYLKLRQYSAAQARVRERTRRS